MWARISRFLPALVILLVTASTVTEVLARGQWVALLPCLAWALWRLTRREPCVLVEAVWTTVGMAVILGVTRVGSPSPGELAGWAVALALLWILRVAQTEPGPDPDHLRTEPVGVDYPE